MVWTPRATAEVGIDDLLVRLNERIEQMLTLKTDVQSRLRVFATELGYDLGFCDLPGCGRPFIRVKEDQRFCPAGNCKSTFHNKYGRRNGDNGA